MANGVKRMMQDNVTKYRRSIAISYVFMFLALFTVISGAFSYWYARKVTQIDHAEVWLQAQALWVMQGTYALFLSLYIQCKKFQTW